MSLTNFYFSDSSGKNIYVNKWVDESIVPKAVVQISHGMAEHSLRYDDFAKFLNKHGFIVYANDHRGHGKTSPDELGYMGEGDAFNLILENVNDLTTIIKKENPDLPVYLLGHSMGSFISLRYSQLYGNNIDGLILSGSNGNQKFIFKIGEIIAKREMDKYGPKAKGYKMEKLSFGAFNGYFKPNKTNFDWLTRDENIVNQFIADPLCGNAHSNSYYYYLLKGLRTNHKKENLEKIPKNLPILIVSGEADPVGLMGKGVKRLYNSLVEIGINSVYIKLYKNARHEILNELNKDEVFDDILKFLNSL